MIKHLRIDNRLIHGQVAVTWMNSIGADKIIVCNDYVANDKIQKMSLPLAARGNTVYVFTIEETIKYVQDHTEETSLAILESGVQVETVNVGNAAPIAGTQYVQINKSIFATKEDAEVYRKIAALRGGKLRSQLTTMNEGTDFLAALSAAGL